MIRCREVLLDRCRASAPACSIVTTERYLHSLPTADETALDALSRIRGPQLVKPA